MLKLDSYYTRRDYYREKISSIMLKKFKCPLLGSWALEELNLKLIDLIEPKHPVWRHTGKFCFHCDSGRH